MDLIIPVHLLVNVSDDVIGANVRANAQRANPRIRTEAAHDRVAVMVGSGPSLSDHLDDVRNLRDRGDVFAMNGAASFLFEKGILADYQVLVDARERTAELVGPAKEHLIASQCDPSLFERRPNARMWHFANGDLDSMLPADEPAHAQIGGAGSVGNCALALAWAMGYRRFEIFGYDSSHRDNASHAFHQSLNDFEPWGRFTFRGREYLCSYTMRSQASRFQAIGGALLNQGCTINVHGTGILPDMWRETVRVRETGTQEERERAKYELAWALPDYRYVSPALEAFDEMDEGLGHPRHGRLVDFGCGSGRAAKRFQIKGLDVLGVDFVPDALEADIPFRDAVLWALPADIRGDYGICCDVLEHIPGDRVEDVVRGISSAVSRLFLQVSTVPDSFGAAIGQPLHLTVQPHAWWLALFDRLGLTVTSDSDLGVASQFVIQKG